MANKTSPFLDLPGLLRFIAEQDAVLKVMYPELAKDNEKYAYAQLAKLSEEVGELNEAVLASYAVQHGRKQGKAYDVAGEVADVLITAMIIARRLNIDIRVALEAKMAIIITRRPVRTMGHEENGVQ